MFNGKSLTIMGLGTCAAACIGAMLLPVFAGIGITGLSGGAIYAIGASLEIVALVAAAVALGGIGMYIVMRTRTPKHTCQTDGTCGCGTTAETRALTEG